MTDFVDRYTLLIDARLAAFVEDEALPGTGVDCDHFWQKFAAILTSMTPENRALLAKREQLQKSLDDWHRARKGQPHDATIYRDFLHEIGYLLEEPKPFAIGTRNVDPEIAALAGPQLVVPALNARFALNAANARWGSLYDALYGTDALDDAPSAAALKDAPTARAGGYDAQRGAVVIARAKAFLDEAVPLASGKWADWQGGEAILANPAQLVGRIKGDQEKAEKREGTQEKNRLLFRNNGLHIELVIDQNHDIGRDDPAGIADIILESALTTIIDLEDSVAAVDTEDKLLGYGNWLGLMRGTLSESFEKNERSITRSVTRTMADDRQWSALGDTRTNRATRFTLPGRSLMFVRNVGHLMTTEMISLPDGSEAPEGICDAVMTSLCAMHDIRKTHEEKMHGEKKTRREKVHSRSNSRTGSIYIVKPKQHGPEECAFTDRLFDAVEDMLGLARYTIKVGVMDEERRTSANLAACIHAVRKRIAFINTGFLDRTGDEIHTSMHSGAMVAKGEMKNSGWIKAYEERNVRIGLACGLSGKAQIGKGMWAMPDLMSAMMEQKIVHPQSGANTAWVPSPTAATLHALHYHAVDVFARQKEIAGDTGKTDKASTADKASMAGRVGEADKTGTVSTAGRADEAALSLEHLLTIPLAAECDETHSWTQKDIIRELDNNCQSILGYVVRWVEQGIGCSKVPDIDDIALMEDRATLRISSQALANWLLHEVCSAPQVDEALRRMAATVDAQNAEDRLYKPMAPNPEESLAFQAARDLIFKGCEQPSGYTEPLLHMWRARAKALAVSRDRKRATQ